jgi:hypothetical protein
MQPKSYAYVPHAPSDPKQPMTLDHADALFRAYAELLSDSPKRGARRSPSLLPAPKRVLMRALRMLVARSYWHGLDSADALRPLIEAAMFLDSFNDEALDSLKFLAAMQQRRTELLDFQQALTGIPRNDPFFWQRVYALLGITSETKRSTFFEHIKARLGRAIRPEPQPVAPRPV